VFNAEACDLNHDEHSLVYRIALQMKVPHFTFATTRFLRSQQRQSAKSSLCAWTNRVIVSIAIHFPSFQHNVHSPSFSISSSTPVLSIWRKVDIRMESVGLFTGITPAKNPFLSARVPWMFSLCFENDWFLKTGYF